MYLVFLDTCIYIVIYETCTHKMKELLSFAWYCKHGFRVNNDKHLGLKRNVMAIEQLKSINVQMRPVNIISGSFLLDRDT